MYGPEDFHEQVTAILCGKLKGVLAAGYHDGTVIMFDTSTFQILQKFSLHSSAITALTFDADVFSFNQSVRSTYCLLEAKTLQ